MSLFALIGISEALWVTILGVIKSISWVLGIAYIGATVKDISTGITETSTQQSEDATITAILARTDITAAQKSILIQAYIDSIAEKAKPVDYATYALYAVGILAAAYVIGQFIGGKK